METETLHNHCVEIFSLIVAGVGIPLVLLQLGDVRRTFAIQSEQLKAQTLSSLYGHYFYYCRLLVEKPYLRAYLYDGGQLSTEPVNQIRRAEVHTVCEFLTGLLEQAEVQQKNLPGDNWRNCWQPLMQEMYKHPKAEMVKFYHAHAHWYSEDFRNRVDGFLKDCTDHPKLTRANSQR
jgi:hypothetical protein